MAVGRPAAAWPGAALLLVDDNATNRDLLTQRLAREGYTNVTIAVSGADALSRLAARNFDLVLLDLMMPGMNGDEVLERMKADARLRHVPVIMISALDEMASVVRCIQLGAEDYLSKPFNATLLRARVSATLERKRLRDEVVAQRDHLERELSAAREIQLAMMRTDFAPPTPVAPLEIDARLTPARQVGGDFYDVFWSDARTLCLVIGDVSDKGAPAALFMARSMALVRVLGARHARERTRLDPAALVARINDELCADNRHAMFVTLFVALLEPATGELRYCNAGHVMPYVVPAAREPTRLEAVHGRPAGIRKDSRYTAVTYTLRAGDTLFLFTDGITDATDASGAFYGDERLARTLARRRDAAPTALVEDVVADVQTFAGEALPFDDIAALAVRRVRAPVVSLTIANRMEDLAAAARLVDDVGRTHALSDDVVIDAHVVIDEVLSNLVRHAYTDSHVHDITITATVDADVLSLAVEDDGIPFDPLAAPAPATEGPLRERPEGGLGIHFVRNLMDSVAYRRIGDRNRLVLERRLSR